MHDHSPPEHSAIRTDLGAIFVSLELSRSTWLITSLSPFAALILFFVLMNVAGGPPAWLAFLLIPIAGVVTEHLRGDKGDDGDRDRRRS